jgi:hypothetical protein
MNALGMVYFYIDVAKDEIKEVESLPDTMSYAGGAKQGRLLEARKALSRLEVIATTLETDRAAKMTEQCIKKIIGDAKEK